MNSEERIDIKLDYITRLFSGLTFKRLELYVISRLWHLLNNDAIHMKSQQRIVLHRSKYALTDIYFPQVDIQVEVNEPAHYASDQRIQQDLRRTEDIEKNTGHRVVTIDCRGGSTLIHKQINALVTEINQLIDSQKQQGIFKPWDPENQYQADPMYWKQKGEIGTFDDIGFHTIEDICQLFDVEPNKIKRGYLRKGGIEWPDKPLLFLWWPSASRRSGWQNTYNKEDNTLTEVHGDHNKLHAHWKHLSKVPSQRIVFYHHTDVLGLTAYKFIGIFMNDPDRSDPKRGIVWKKIGERLNLKAGTFSMDGGHHH